MIFLEAAMKIQSTNLTTYNLSVEKIGRELETSDFAKNADRLGPPPLNHMVAIFTVVGAFVVQVGVEGGGGDSKI